ncbi:MAG TPA: hypothetical protein DD643_00485 [Synechococcus sp. UBA8638]|nr:hypothetical protein [Synechococcus sp. UBA8638]
MGRRDLLNLGMGAAVFSLAELAWRQAGRPALGAKGDNAMGTLRAWIPRGDPLQVLLDGNARLGDVKTRSSRHPPRRHSNVYWPNTGGITAT